MQVTLPRSGKKADLRDFVPHRVVVDANEALYKGVQIKSHAMSPTKEELQEEFGVEVIASLDSVDGEAYEKKLALLKEEFLRRKVEMDGMTLGNVQEANIRKVAGITQKLDGIEATRDAVEDLPHDDFAFLLTKYEEIFAGNDQKKSSAA